MPETQDQRPGVPMEAEPKPFVKAHWTAPAEQAIGRNVVLKSVSRRKMTPVFGTAEPPAGLSGAVRRIAYRIPEHHASHWLLLMASDRIDVTETIVKRGLNAHTLLIGLATGFLSAGLMLGLRQRRAWPFRA